MFSLAHSFVAIVETFSIWKGSISEPFSYLKRGHDNDTAERHRSNDKDSEEGQVRWKLFWHAKEYFLNYVLFLRHQETRFLVPNEGPKYTKEKMQQCFMNNWWLIDLWQLKLLKSLLLSNFNWNPLWNCPRRRTIWLKSSHRRQPHEKLCKISHIPAPQSFVTGITFRISQGGRWLRLQSKLQRSRERSSRLLPANREKEGKKKGGITAASFF